MQSQPGQGTLIEARIPLPEDELYDSPRVLLADDHRMVAEGLRSLLEPEFELVEIVEDGRQLIEAAERLAPDVIVVDITMPFMNGLDAVELPQGRVQGKNRVLDHAPGRDLCRHGASGRRLGLLAEELGRFELLDGHAGSDGGADLHHPASGGTFDAVLPKVVRRTRRIFQP